MENSMSFLTGENGRKISIELLQEEVKKEVIATYKAVRKSKRITQSKLAEMTGIAQPNITRFESDGSNPTLELMVKMAAAMGMKLTIGFEALDNESIDE